jgi:diaminopimelate epimerase
MSRPFLKMNGLGNDFVVVEARQAPFRPTIEEVRAIADRQAGIGCDQLIAIEPGQGADAFMRIWNADGGEVEACGNAARCVAWLVGKDAGAPAVRIDSPGGMLVGERLGERRVRMDMGVPRLHWQEIPLAREMDTAALDFDVGEPGLVRPGAVNIGNPHCVFFVPDAAVIEIERIGPRVEHDPLFPARVNVEVVEVRNRGRVRMRVWERGVGVTRACGTGACASVVAAVRRGLTDRRVVVELDGGELEIEWREADGHVLMTGPVEVEFSGDLP